MRAAVLYGALVAVWVVTPLMGDRVPVWGQWAYGVALVAVCAAGIITAVRGGRPVLGFVSLLTLFAWPILLVVAMGAGGVSR